MLKIKRSESRAVRPCPVSDGCARSSMNGWEWREWALTASPSERARVRGTHVQSRDINSECSKSHSSNFKGLSARTNRVKLRNLLAAADGADLLKATQLKVIGGCIFMQFFGSFKINILIVFMIRQGKNVYVSNGARYMTGVLLRWNQLRQRTLLSNMLENSSVLE